jgi:membrane protein DedA with SNARE-associated domain
MHQVPQHVPSVIHALIPVVNKYGYLAVFGFLFLEDFGLLVPGETVLITAAVFAGLGDLNIVLVFLVGFLGAVLGDNLSFAIGEYGGHPLAQRFGKYIFLTPKRISDAEAFYNRNGGKVVAVARFINGLRQLNGFAAGLSEMKWPKFLTFNAIGAALWVGVWSSVGYVGGSHISTFLRYQLYLTIVTVSAFVVFVLIKIKKKKASMKDVKPS